MPDHVALLTLECDPQFIRAPSFRVVKLDRDVHLNREINWILRSLNPLNQLEQAPIIGAGIERRITTKRNQIDSRQLRHLGQSKSSGRCRIPDSFLWRRCKEQIRAKLNERTTTTAHHASTQPRKPGALR